MKNPRKLGEIDCREPFTNHYEPNLAIPCEPTNHSLPPYRGRVVVRRWAVNNHLEGSSNIGSNLLADEIARIVGENVVRMASMDLNILI
jgi:hypothetical protein